jgi:hypothetical protein
VEESLEILIPTERFKLEIKVVGWRDDELLTFGREHQNRFLFGQVDQRHHVAGVSVEFDRLHSFTFPCL